MALDDIFRALEEQADAECDAILAAARDQASTIAGEAEARADEVRRAKVEVSERAARAVAAQRLNAARLDARKLVAGVKDRAIRAAFDGAEERFETLRSDRDYSDVFSSLAAEALSGVDGEVQVRVSEEDVALARKALGALGAKAEVVGDLETAGGLVVVANAGTLFRKNTVEDRIARLRDGGQSAVAGILLS